MRRPILATSSLLVAVAFLVLAAVPASAQSTGDELKDALENVRKQRVELEAKLQALRQKELALEKEMRAAEKKGYYIRVEIKGLLQKQVMANFFGGVPPEWEQWTVTVGKHAYVLNWAKPTPDTTKLMQSLDGKAVVVSGRLFSHSDPRMLPMLDVETFKAAKD